MSAILGLNPFRAASAIYANAAFSLLANTADGADNSAIRISGGGAYATDGSRGGQIALGGNENALGGNIEYRAGNGGSGNHLFYVGNNVLALSVSSAGNISLLRTVTAGGTTGAQTINKPAGTVNFAAAATTLVVTNSLVSTTSIVYCVIRTADTTATIKNVVCAAGSFTITLGAAATAETSVGFLVTN